LDERTVDQWGICFVDIWVRNAHVSAAGFHALVKAAKDSMPPPALII
jgi:hypothetical protein